jgi:hypothetical protein
VAVSKDVSATEALLVPWDATICVETPAAFYGAAMFHFAIVELSTHFDDDSSGTLAASNYAGQGPKTIDVGESSWTKWSSFSQEVAAGVALIMPADIGTPVAADGYEIFTANVEENAGLGSLGVSVAKLAAGTTMPTLQLSKNISDSVPVEVIPTAVYNAYISKVADFNRVAKLRGDLLNSAGAAGIAVTNVDITNGKWEYSTVRVCHHGFCCVRVRAIGLRLLYGTVRVFGRNLHSRIPLVPPPARVPLLHACGQWHSSRASTFLLVGTVNSAQTLKGYNRSDCTLTPTPTLTMNSAQTLKATTATNLNGRPWTTLSSPLRTIGHCCFRMM